MVTGTITLDTLELPTGSHEEVPGGSALYGAMGAAQVRSCVVLGKAGEDLHPTALAPLRARGVDLVGLQWEPGSTFRWTARYAEDLGTRETLTREPGVGVSPPTVPKILRTGVSWAFLGSMDPRLQRSVVEQLGLGVHYGLDTMGHWIAEYREDLLELVKDASVLFVSEDEARLLGGSDKSSTAAHRLVERGAGCVVVKAGARGAVAFTNSGPPLESPPVAIETVVDPTGAGDAFGGAFTASRSQGYGIARALASGSAAASFAVEGVSFRGFDRAREGAFERRVALAIQKIHPVGTLTKGQGGKSFDG